MSTYVREKVLRIPLEKLNMTFTEEEMDDLGWAIEKRFPENFNYGEKGKFQLSPTESLFVDFLIDKEWDADGEYGKTRALTDREKAKYLPVFQQIDPDINMDFVRLVEFCWYNCCEAPDYYDEIADPFYEEV
jgi:hypothetical protein